MPQPAAQQFSGIFVSYRRDDAAGHAGRLSDKLSEHFGKDQIFMDIDNIQPGEDFVQVIENAVGSCEILIVIIGRHWLSSAEGTSRWLNNPNDFVRLEIAAALNRDIRVIPVLVQRATMPNPKDLPDDLTKLSRRHALELTDNRWQRDVDQLIHAIEKIRDELARRRAAGLVGPPPEPIPRRARNNRPLFIAAAMFIAAVMLIAVIVIAAALFGEKKQPDGENTNTPSVNADTSSTTSGSQTEKSTDSLTSARTDGEGTIFGKITWTGPAARVKIDTSADPECGQMNPNLTTEDILVRNGKLANVFVYIKDGTTAYGQKLHDLSFETPASEVVLDQKGCRFVPHVLGLQVSQNLKITNSDPTQHNIHPTPKNNLEWNQTQPNGAPQIEKSFASAEVLVPVKCNQHPWMKAYIGVLKHPFFAVSREDGAYTIKAVPPGTYTLAAWHEKGGPSGTEKTMEVTVPASGSVNASFSFGEAQTATNRPGLEIMPALDVLISGLHQH